MPNRRFSTHAPAEILLVEDHPGDIRLLQEAFKESAFAGKLSITRDGQEAMDFLHQAEPYSNCRRPDLILLDLNLPRKSGLEVLAEVKREPNLRQIPVVVLSTSRNQDDVCRSYDLHANCYIPKPVDLDRLIDFSKAIEAFWLNWAVLPRTGL
jgi:chemotaxis family two-component system response regulator Rcp1